MASATLEKLDVEIECQGVGCDGKGYIDHPVIRIAPSHQAYHLKHHAYSRDPDTKQFIGADCNCPRLIGKPTRSKCYACKGTGIRRITLVVPRPRQKVNVLDKDLLVSIFGDDVPHTPGVVFDVQDQEEHHLELRTGLGVRVTWDRLTQAGTIPKGKQVELWTFDLLELEIVK